MSSYNVPLEPVVVEEAKRYLADLQATQGINKSMRQMIAEAIVEYLSVRGYLGGNVTYADFLRALQSLEEEAPGMYPVKEYDFSAQQVAAARVPYKLTPERILSPVEKPPGQRRGGRSAISAVLTWAKSIVARREMK